ncbi:MAG TPA: hypothetical protein VGR22_11100 [Thermomicrobiales bacterium]|nr:hypothetical protein [Thermomicrobiales bacterium]
MAAALGAIADPVVEQGEANLRQQVVPGTEIRRRSALLRSFVTSQLTEGMRSLLVVGAVYEAISGDAAQTRMQLHRDGLLRWCQRGRGR